MRNGIIDNLEASIMWCGEETFKECLESVKSQTFKPAHIEIIKDVRPINESVNARHGKLKKKYSVKVDADMILDPKCFEVLYKKIVGLGDEYWAVSVMLDDPFIGKMGGVHIQRSEYIQDIVLPNIMGCDRYLVDLMKRKGFKHLELEEIFGIHKCDTDPETVFKRHLRMGQKHRCFKSVRHEDWVKNIGHKWLDKNDTWAFIALVGYCLGLTKPGFTEKDEYFGSIEWMQIKELIDAKVIPCIE